jgi:hypothetical protein
MSASPEVDAIFQRWRTEPEEEERERLLQQLFKNGAYPKEMSDYQEAWDISGGFYPDYSDPNFIPKLMRKREFQESSQKSIKDALALGEDKCRSSEDFELSSVQRFVSRLLSPKTPYNSALFYHGVGVGKTCAAVTVCESYLESFPGREVFIVAPPNIQEGFRRTIFDATGLKMGPTNKHRGCTGDIYLKLTNTLTEKSKDVVEKRVTSLINKRYKFFGYTSFANYIKEILKRAPSSGDAAAMQAWQGDALRREFSNRVLIIDEAHNLRDNPLETAEDAKDDSLIDAADSKGGKILTPFLNSVLSVSEGITLVLMTATPMYNSYVEIIFLLNLLLKNDKLKEMKPSDIFDLKGESFRSESSKVLLGKVAAQYISFMRGENPLTFPIRLKPIKPFLPVWPNKTPKGERIESEEERDAILSLPFVAAYFHPEIEKLYKETSLEIVSSAEGLGITNMDTLVQAGNWIYPGEEDIQMRIRQSGFDNTFVKEKRGNSVYFKSVDEEAGAEWLLDKNLNKSSGKCSVLIKRLAETRGVSFVYSRFVASGALTIALALEANGYTLYGRDQGFLEDGVIHPGGRQCALCPMKENGHAGDHKFKPAKYVLITGSEELSPNNKESITACRANTNIYGGDVKVILGSQVAGEGLDLRFIREIVVFDSWYHLNKLEQIIGRGIRNCSHALLPANKRNCTIVLLVNTYATEPSRETIDMYSYRTAMRKAVIVGNVTRVLKEYAIDCTLNYDAIVIEDVEEELFPEVVDAQGVEREPVDINDTPLTSMCDWLDDCSYKCRATSGLAVDKPGLEELNSSSYDEYTARYQMSVFRRYLEDFFQQPGQSFLTFEQIHKKFENIPAPLLTSILKDMTSSSTFKISTEHGEGHLVYRNGYYIFQPDLLDDTSIPMAIRMLNIPVSKDDYGPMKIVIESEEQEDIVSIEQEDSEELWNQVVEWVGKIKTRKAGLKVPELIKSAISELRESAGIKKVQEERIEQILWMYNYVKADQGNLDIFAECILDYFWDEFITISTKKTVLEAGGAEGLATAKHSFWDLEGSKYIRLVNSFTNEIEYFKQEGTSLTPVSRAIKEVLRREVGKDPRLAIPIDNKTTGFKYGFMIYNPKKKRLVFKKSDAPKIGKKVTRGSECSINSGTSDEQLFLEKIGDIMREKIGTDIGLNHQTLAAKKEKNSIRICTISDIALRFMDRKKVDSKRWFYRPLEATLHKHPLR